MELYVESLWCLHQSVFVAWHRSRCSIVTYVTQCLNNIRYRHCRTLSACRLEAAANHLNAWEGAHTIVDGHHSFGIVGHVSQSVSYGVEARFAAIGNLIVFAEAVILTQSCPMLMSAFGQYEYYLQRAAVFPKPAYGAHQYRDVTHGQKLLRYIVAHSQSLAAAEDDGIVCNAVIIALHFHIF